MDLGTAGKDKYYGYGCPYMADYFANTFGGKHLETKVGTCAVESLGNSKDGLRLSWTSADNASGYKIAEIKGSGVRTYTDKTAAAGIRYRYAVRGVNGTAEGQPAATKALVRLTQPKYNVKNAYSGVKVSWNKVKGASGYKIYRKAPGQNGWKQYKVLSAGTLTFVDKNTRSRRSRVLLQARMILRGSGCTGCRDARRKRSDQIPERRWM